jgi:hypothetical protein
MSKLNTEKTFDEIYQAVKGDRTRAIETFEAMKEMVSKADRITPGMLDALNGAQQLIQTSTDKLVNLASLINKKEAIEKATEMNTQFDRELLKDKDSAEIIKTTPSIGMLGHKK